MRVVRALGPFLLLLHLILNLFPISQQFWSEVLLYNLVPAGAVMSILLAPRITDPIVKPAIASALSIWSVGSIIASSSAFYEVPSFVLYLSNIFYFLFYPLVMIGFPRLVGGIRELKLLEVVDASIFGLGLSTLGTAFILKPVIPQFAGQVIESFFAVAFPVSDLILICIVLASISVQAFSTRGLYLCLGVAVFALTDFLYLWIHLKNDYSIGSILDDGWLLAFVIVAESFWQKGVDRKIDRQIDPVLITLSVFLSATLLALIAIQPSYFPRFILIPAISTLALAFIRMAIALHQARNIGHERLLARTDELTSLPNRRKLISEIENFVSKEGSLLLLDLDGFKPINDLYGHEMGDKVLQQVALRFERALPSGVLLARLGGDEFGVLFEGAHESALEVALALRATLSYPFNINNQEIRLGVSVGIAKNTGQQDLLVRADNAMYKAKREGLGVCRL